MAWYNDAVTWVQTKLPTWLNDAGVWIAGHPYAALAAAAVLIYIHIF